MTVTLPTDDPSLEEGAVYLELKIDDGNYTELEPTTSTDINIDNDNTDTRKCYRIDGDEWTNKSASISVSEALLVAANGGTALNDGQTISVKAFLVDNANNISALAIDTNIDSRLTVDKTIPNLVSISYDDPASTPTQDQPYPKNTVIPLRLTIESESADADSSKVTLLNNGTIDVTLNVGSPNTV